MASLSAFQKGLIGTGLIMAVSWERHSVRFAQKQDSTGSETPSQITEFRDKERRELREDLMRRFGDKVDVLQNDKCTEAPS